MKKYKDYKCNKKEDKEADYWDDEDKKTWVLSTRQEI